MGGGDGDEAKARVRGELGGTHARLEDREEKGLGGSSDDGLKEEGVSFVDGGDEWRGGIGRLVNEEGGYLWKMDAAY